NPQTERLRYAQAATDQQLRERSIETGARVEVARDLVETQIVALDVGRRKPLDPQRGVRGDESILNRVVEADHERAERIVDGLRRELASLDDLREVGDEVPDLVDRQLAERTAAECGHEALTSVDLVVGPRAGLQVRPAPRQPPVPVAAERFLRVPNLPALHLLDQPTPRVPCGTLVREATLRRLSPIAAAIDKPPADTFGGPVRVHAAVAAVAGCVAAAGG